jgi:KDO2-lipid IV(A) lauroyltransferase
LKRLAISIVMRVFSWITPPMAVYIAPPVAAVLWYLSPRKRRVTRLNLRAVYPQMDSDARDRIARASMVHYIRGVFEAGILWHWPLEKILQYFDEPEGYEHIQTALQRGKGLIVAAPHSGSWELLSLFMQQKLDCTLLYKPGRHPDVDELLLEKRRRTGARLVPANSSGLRALYKVIKGGGAVGILPDQEPTRGDGEFAPFFGIETLTGVLLPRIAQRTGATVVFLVCARHGKGRYRVHCLPADKAIASDDTRVALTALNEGIERTIEVDSSQYLWAYKRFRNRPEGETSIYKSAGA